MSLLGNNYNGSAMPLGSNGNNSSMMSTTTSSNQGMIMPIMQPSMPIITNGNANLINNIDNKMVNIKKEDDNSTQHHHHHHQHHQHTGGDDGDDNGHHKHGHHDHNKTTHNKHNHHNHQHDKKESGKKDSLTTMSSTAVETSSSSSSSSSSSAAEKHKEIEEKKNTKTATKQTRRGNKRKRDHKHKSHKHKKSKRSKKYDDDDDDEDEDDNDDDDEDSSSSSDSDEDDESSSSESDDSDSDSDDDSVLDKKKMKLMLMNIIQGGYGKSMFGEFLNPTPTHVHLPQLTTSLTSTSTASATSTSSTSSSVNTTKNKKKKVDKPKEMKDELPYIYLKFVGSDGPNFFMKNNVATLGRDKTCQFRIAERTLRSKVLTIICKPRKEIYVVPAKDQAISIDDVPVTSGICRVRWGQKISFSTGNLFSFILVASNKLFNDEELSPSYDDFYEVNKKYIIEKEPPSPEQTQEKKTNTSKTVDYDSLFDGNFTPFNRRVPFQSKFHPIKSTLETNNDPEPVIAVVPAPAPATATATAAAPVSETAAQDNNKNVKKPTETKVDEEHAAENNENNSNVSLYDDIKWPLDYYFDDMKDPAKSQAPPPAAIPDVEMEDTKKPANPNADIETCFKVIKEQLIEIFSKNVIPPEAITESLGSFSYYLNKTVQQLLVNSAYLYLERPNFARIAAGLKTLTRTVLLCAPEGTELYQEALGKALAKHFNASVLTVGRDDFTHNVVKFVDGKAILKCRPYGKSASLLENTTTTNADGSSIYDNDNFYDEDNESHTSFPKVGDRIIYNRSGTLGMHPDKSRTKDGPEDGARGTVVLQFSYTKRVGIQFDKEFPLGSTLGGFSKEGCGAFVETRYIEHEDSKMCTEQLVLEAVGEVLSAAPQRPTVVLVKEPISLFERSASLPTSLKQLINKVESEKLPVIFFALNSNKEWKKYKSIISSGGSSSSSSSSSAHSGPFGSGGISASALLGSSISAAIGGTSIPLKQASSLFGEQSGAPTKTVYIGSRASAFDAVGSAGKAKKSDLGKNTLEDRFRCLAQLFPTSIEVKAPTESIELSHWRDRIANDTFKIKLRANKETIERVQDKLSVQVIGDVTSIPEMNNTLFTKDEMSQIIAHAISDYLQNSSDSVSPSSSSTSKTTPPQSPSSSQQQSQPGSPTKTQPKQRLLIPLKCFSTGLKIVMNSKPDKAKSLISTVSISNDFERTILSDVITPEESNVRFKDVGALDDVKKLLYETVMLPLQRPELFRRGNLAKPTKGILLFGPPGTGKTLIARAIATESGANFISITPSSVTSKYVGDSNKLIKAVFSLAAKIAPTVIFVDEVDSLLSSRSNSNENDVTRKIKNEFMACWDGLRTNQTERVIVLAATNRPMDLDDAVLRRLSRRILVDLPDTANREKILRIILKDEDLEDNFDFGDLAKKTVGYSGSDLRNLCIAAAQRPLREFLQKEKEEEEEEKRKKKEGAEHAGEHEDKSEEDEASKVMLDPPSPMSKAYWKKKSDPNVLRKLNAKDFDESIQKVGKSVSDDAPSLKALRKWNQEFGDGNKVAIPQFSYYN